MRRRSAADINIHCFLGFDSYADMHEEDGFAGQRNIHTYEIIRRAFAADTPARTPHSRCTAAAAG